MRSAACAVAVLFAALAAAADEKPVVKEVATKDLKIAFPEKWPGIANPEVITSAEALAKSAAFKGAADALKKQVDFSKEKLVAFLWEGSGGDRMTVELLIRDGKPLANFRMTPGRTFDLRQHVKLFVVPKDLAVNGSTDKG